MQDIDELRQNAKTLKSNGMSWGQISQELCPDQPVKKVRVLIYRITKDGYEPQNNAVREMLGLSKIIKMVACRTCNIVHTAQCPETKASNLPVPPGFVVVDADLCSCGRAFPARAGRKWCSKACSSREYRRRKREGA